MIDWLLVARDNGYGLTGDSAILTKAIDEAGRTSSNTGVRARGLVEWLVRRKRAKRILHVERAFPRWFSAGKENWLIPNQERFPRRHLGRLKHIDHVLAKTRHAEAIFAPLAGKVSYLGFTSEDRLVGSVAKDWNRFFHLAGGSTLKGTEDVLALWRDHPEWPELVLVQKADNAPSQVPSNVRLISGFLDDAGLKTLQNQCGIHLCPSRAEGWGHNILEAMSVGAVVLTTDAPPMNEHVTADCGVLVTSGRMVPRHLGTCYHVDIQALERAILAVIAMPPAEKQRLGRAAQTRFHDIDAAFRRRAREIFGAGSG